MSTPFRDAAQKLSRKMYFFYEVYFKGSNNMCTSERIIIKADVWKFIARDSSFVAINIVRERKIIKKYYEKISM